MGENEYNIKDFKISLYNYIINYIMANRNKNRDQINFHIDRNLYQNFVMVCQKLGLCPRGSKGNLAIEGFMHFMVEQFKNSPITIQTTLFYKPKIEKVEVKQEVNVAQRLELKLTVRDLSVILDALEKRRGDPQFLMSRLREVLPKALRVYERAADDKLAQLLAKAEKWVGES